MTPKEKAEDLLDKYTTYIMNSYKFHFIITKDEIYLSKKCALIAVDEILSDYKNYLLHENTAYKGLMYWKEVKQEIEKL
jgi:hypothetical protein